MFMAPFLIINVFVQINFQIIAGIWLVWDRIKILLSTMLLNAILICIFIFGYKYKIIPFPNGSSAASFAVWISWLLMWWMSYRVIKKYVGSFQYKIFLYNLMAVLWVIFIYYKFMLYEYIPSFWLTGRFESLPTILFAFFVCIAIFFLINYSKMKDFVWIIRSVRNKA